MAHSTVDRRTFLRYAGGAAAVLGGTAALAACDAPTTSTTADGAKYGTVAAQLSWIKNVEFAGEYFAAVRGYYTAAGFGAVDLISGGAAGTAAEAGLDTGRIWIGLSAPQLTAPAVLGGLAAKIVGATYQKNPFCIVSSATNPLTTPHAMIGKKIGVQDSNQLIFSALLDANHIDPKLITTIPVQFDASPLANGDVDGWVGFTTVEPIALAAKGFPNHAMLFADFHLPLVAETFTVRQHTIDHERDKLKAFLTAEIKGWRDAVADPAGAARLAATVYGKDQNLDIAEQTREATAQNALIVSADTRAHGLFTITDSLIDANIAALRNAKIDILPNQLFDMTLLTEIYTEHPDLKTS